MSSNLMDTEVGGEQTQYESQSSTQQPLKKSGGQLGEASTVTTDNTSTREDAMRLSERGERTAENIRYGQGISENGVAGFTTGQSGETTTAEFGRVEDQVDDDARGEGEAERAASGYGEGNDVGA